ncbi:hypothetical protein AYO20_10997 [Fonsecaea nubica]|uniref:Uncharacterized protein n=1 Tax=Fonsecaea nubica TaxID=856822 RepID=A0A178C3A4_9EURO|nr:hypothetical protein AYO20_10997 [Fonsecaea nubica]OAL23552.1 hypothetical protein AYO20_10997 [Fonsecaea nubica]
MPFLKLIPVERPSAVGNASSSAAKRMLDGYITAPNSKDSGSTDDASGCKFLKLTPDTASNINKNNSNDDNNKCDTDATGHGHHHHGQNQAQGPGQDKNKGQAQGGDQGHVQDP